MIDRYNFAEGEILFSFYGEWCKHADVVNEHGWRSIESAPKDGTFIDLWVHAWGAGRIAGAKWGYPSDDADGEPADDAVECWVHLDWHTTYDGWYWTEIDEAPSHWMHIPGAPK